MAKLNSSALNEDEIEEELINNDLISSGGVQEPQILQQMDLEEKKNLLSSIQQSKEEFQKENSTSSKPSKKTIVINTSSAEFPPLAAAAKGNKLKLPRKPSPLKQADTDNSADQCIDLLDEEDDNDSLFYKPKKFSLPYCIPDNAPALPIPSRPVRQVKCPYYQMKGENAADCMKRMLAHHNAWKDKYIAETSNLESRALVKNIQDLDDKEINSDIESDPYTFTEVTKTYAGPKTKNKQTNKTTMGDNTRTLQRRPSRDSDCEEIQPTLKPEEPKLGEWMTAARPRNKRNRKQISNRDRTDNQPDVHFDFDGSRSLWGAGQSGAGPQSPAPGRRSLPKPSVREVEEEKVQCPICQRDYLRSIVENHAATCEGFSSSPMDVEEGP